MNLAVREDCQVTLDPFVEKLTLSKRDHEVLGCLWMLRNTVASLTNIARRTMSRPRYPLGPARAA